MPVIRGRWRMCDHGWGNAHWRQSLITEEQAGLLKDGGSKATLAIPPGACTVTGAFVNNSV